MTQREKNSEGYVVINYKPFLICHTHRDVALATRRFTKAALACLELRNLFVLH